MVSRESWKQDKFRLPVSPAIKLTVLAMTVCVIFIVITTFTPAPTGLLSRECPCEDGLAKCICARSTVQALSVFQIICLANSRITAYACYPLFVLLCVTMSRNLLAYLQHTVIVEYLPLSTASHQLHVWAGTWVGILIMWHGLWHLIRWGVQDELRFLVEHPTGITGLIMLTLTPFIVWPMKLEALRKNITFEARKRTHYTSWIWLGSLCFHAPARNVFWIIGVPFVIYLCDWFYGLLKNTKMAPSARFVRLESAVMIRLKKPDGFELKGSGGYCYLCIPWISKFEWHAFSVFKDPYDDDYICFCVAAAGDWTKKLHAEVHEPIHRRLWLCGPFPSPFETAIDNDNVISVASGIGITPALSAIKSLADHRKMHLIWMVRDASLLEFFFDFGIVVDSDAHTLIFYTGKRELVFRRPLPYNVHLFKGRPNLDDLVIKLIQASTSGKELDVSSYEAMNLHHADEINGDLDADPPLLSQVEHEFYNEVTRLLSTYSREELFRAAVSRSHLNSRSISFQGLCELIEDIFVRRFSEDQIKDLFSKFDKTNKGIISWDEFDGFMKELEKNSEKHYDRIREAKRKEDEQHGKEGRAFKRRSTVLFSVVVRPDHWRLLYCGGSAPVIDKLKNISGEHHIPLSIESFAW